VVVTFFPDTRQVALLDVYLKTPLIPDLLRSQFGTRIMVREREAGVTEELYYPKLQSLSVTKKDNTELVGSVGYVSPRLIADAFVERSRKLRSEKNFSEAQTEADKAVLVDPDYARSYLEQGYCLSGLKSESEALVSYVAAANARYGPQDISLAHTEVAMQFWKTKNWLDSVPTEFQQAIAAAPDLDEPHMHYAEFLLEQKKADQAQTELAAAVRLNPGNMEARTLLADYLFGRSQFAEALPQYGALSAWAETPQANTADNAKAELHLRYGTCLSRTQKSADAIAALLKAVQRNASLTAAWSLLGSEYRKSKDFEKAMGSYRSGIKVNPQDFDLNQGLGNALLESGQSDAARRQMEETLRLRPNDAMQRFYLARCWAALNKKKEAISWIQQAIAAGLKDRALLTGDPFLQSLQKDGDFKKLLLTIS
jgi:tetratricopeptide (TPR) repeat protein